MTQKTCTKCGVTKDVELFVPCYGEKGRSSYKSWCKGCHTACGVAYKRRNAAARARYAEQRRGYDIERKFGITGKQYDQILAVQGGVCALCRTNRGSINFGGKPRRLAVDHDHDTGRVRGLLCERCNRGVGLLGDDPALLRRAADYIDRFRVDGSESAVPASEGPLVNQQQGVEV